MRAGEGGHRGPSAPRTPVGMTQRKTRRSEEADRLNCLSMLGRGRRIVFDAAGEGPHSEFREGSEIDACGGGWTAGSFDSADSAQDDTKNDTKIRRGGPIKLPLSVRERLRASLRGGPSAPRTLVGMTQKLVASGVLQRTTFLFEFQIANDGRGQWRNFFWRAASRALACSGVGRVGIQPFV